MTDDLATGEQAPAEPEYAFRCNNCNSLAEPGVAGERLLPAKCTTCGKGVRFSEDGIKEYDDSNWTVLADLDDDGILDVISYHGEIKIVAHTPAEAADPDHEPQNIDVETVGDNAAGAVDNTEGAQA